MTDTAQNSTATPFVGVPNRDIIDDLWPVMGILFAVLATLAWDGLLVWTFIRLL